MKSRLGKSAISLVLVSIRLHSISNFDCCDLLQTNRKISLGPGVCGPVLGGGCLSWRASSPVLEGAVWAGSPLVGGVWPLAGDMGGRALFILV